MQGRGLDAIAQEPALIFLFGLAGAGKSYVAQLLARKADYHVYEGDGDLPPAMRAAIARQEPFSDAMRDELCERLIERIRELRETHGRLVITQALYKERHRQRVQAAFPEMRFVWVQASDETIAQRLAGRSDAVTPQYAATMRKNFEPPSVKSLAVLNEGPEEGVWNSLRTGLGLG